MRDKFVVVNYDELKEGDPVIFFGVHVLRWNYNLWGDPSIAITSEDDDRDERIASLEADRAELVAALESVNALIEEEMGEWYGVAFAHLPVRMANLAHMRDGIDEALAKASK